MGAYREGLPACFFHPSVPAARACCQCNVALCDGCSAFDVDDRVACEACGRLLARSGRERIVGGIFRAVVLVLAGAAGLAALWCAAFTVAQWGVALVGLLVPVLGVFVLIALVRALRREMRQATYGVFGGAAPKVRRRPRVLSEGGA